MVSEKEAEDAIITFKKSVYDAWFSCSSNKVEDGDIICFQKRSTPENEEQVQFHDDPSFLQFLKNRQKRMKKEKEEEDKGQHEAQAHLYTTIKVARGEDLWKQIGKDIFFDLVDHDKVCSFRIQKETTFNLFKEEVSKQFGIPVAFQRFWIWAKRENHTYRPSRPLTPQEEAQTVGELSEVSNKTNDTGLKLFLEVECGQDFHLLSPPEKGEKDILLFFRLYDPEKEELRYVGRLFVKSFGKPIEILAKLNELAGFAPDEEIELFEEIKFEPNVTCERLDKRVLFGFSEIKNGGIIWFQKRPTPELTQQFRYPDVPSFLEHVKNGQQQREKEILVLHSDSVEDAQPLVKVPQPKGVLQSENASAAENKAVDEPQAYRFIWTIKNFTRFNTKKCMAKKQKNVKDYSDVFVAGNYLWRILIFPKGNNVDCLSIYLDVADSANLPDGWSRYAKFSLAVVNQIHNKNTIKEVSAEHQFNKKERDWGFASFVPLSKLHNPSKGFLVNDTCVIEAEVDVRKVH